MTYHIGSPTPRIRAAAIRGIRHRGEVEGIVLEEHIIDGADLRRRRREIGGPDIFERGHLNVVIPGIVVNHAVEVALG